MTAIKYSPCNPGNWIIEEFDGEDAIGDYIKERYTLANKEVLDGTISAFNSIVFSKAHLAEILSQDRTVEGGNPCTHIAFSHLFVTDGDGNKHSTLFAIGEDDNGGIFARPDDKFFVGTPLAINFNSGNINEHFIKKGYELKGYTWAVDTEVEKKIEAWLNDLSKQRSFLKSIDMFIRVRFNEDDKILLFNENHEKDIEIEDKLIAFFPSVFYCEVNIPTGENPDDSGNYCTLVGCEVTKDGTLEPKTSINFLVCTNAWRPNWPKGRNQNIVERIEAIKSELNDLIHIVENKRSN